MRLYNNIWVAIAYFFGIGVKNSKNKLKNTIEKRDNRKEKESLTSYSSMNNEERTKRGKILDKRGKWAMISLLCSITGIVFLFILLLIDSSSTIYIFTLSVTLSIVILSVLYGLWYSLFGKYW